MSDRDRLESGDGAISGMGEDKVGNRGGSANTEVSVQCNAEVNTSRQSDISVPSGAIESRADLEETADLVVDPQLLRMINKYRA